MLQVRSIPVVGQKIRSRLLELRTNCGLLYVSPSFWERLYLLWTFRNFDRLPLQVLNRHQKELIQELSRKAIVAKKGPLARSSLIGSVENILVAPVSEREAVEIRDKLVRIRASAAELPKAVGSQMGTRLIHFPAKSRSVERISLAEPTKVQARAETSRANLFPHVLRYLRKGSWSAIGIAMACTVVLLTLLFHSREERLVTFKSIPKEVAIEARNDALRNAPKIASAPQKVQPSMLAKTAPSVQSASSQVPLGKVESELAKTVELNPTVLSPEEVNPIRPYMSEWPESGFRYPTAPSATQTGTVVLKAIVGTNGIVTNIEVFSGNRSLARAAAEAVQGWQFVPYKVNGNAVEAETRIRIDFRGEDAVSISFVQGDARGGNRP